MGEKLPVVGAGGCVTCACAHAGPQAYTHAAVMAHAPTWTSRGASRTAQLPEAGRGKGGVAEPWWPSGGRDQVDISLYTRDSDPGQQAHHSPIGNSEQGSCKLHRPKANDPY